MNPRNLGDIKYGLEHGIGVSAGANGDLYSLQPDGSVLDGNGQQMLAASEEGKALYGAFTGFNNFTLSAATPSALGGVKAAVRDSSTDTVECKIGTDGKLYAAALSAASASALGGVKMAANVAEAAGNAPTATEFKALLDALIASGAMAAGA